MTNEQMADYRLIIKADSGYESTTEGRCSAEQYGQAIAALHGEVPQRKPLTRGQIREIEVDVSLNPSFDYITPAEQLCRAIEAAHGIKEQK